ncbi:MAG: hypothetical protein AAGJ39_12500, partial [Pseudomonadota bacterium]
MSDGPQIVPYLSYEDGPRAIEFLVAAFGFEVVFQNIDDAGALVHAELKHGSGMVLVGTDAQPKGSPGIYVVVEDVPAHHSVATAAGAQIVFPPED